MNCNEHKYRVYGWSDHDGDRDGIGCEDKPPPPDAEAMIKDGGAYSVHTTRDGVPLSYDVMKGGTNFAFDEKDLKAAINFSEGRVYAYKVVDDELVADRNTVGLDLHTGTFVITLGD